MIQEKNLCTSKNNLFHTKKILKEMKLSNGLKKNLLDDKKKKVYHIYSIGFHIILIFHKQ